MAGRPLAAFVSGDTATTAGLVSPRDTAGSDI